MRSRRRAAGFAPALDKVKKFHGLGPYDPETGETKAAGQKTYSEIFAETLVKLADRDQRVVAITAAMPNGTALDLFRHTPEAVFRCGDCGGACGVVCGRDGDQGVPAVLRDLLDVSAAGV